MEINKSLNRNVNLKVNYCQEICWIARGSQVLHFLNVLLKFYWLIDCWINIYFICQYLNKLTRQIAWLLVKLLGNCLTYKNSWTDGLTTPSFFNYTLSLKIQFNQLLATFNFNFYNLSLHSVLVLKQFVFISWTSFSSSKHNDLLCISDWIADDGETFYRLIIQFI